MCEYVSLCVWKGVKADFKRDLLALISVDMGGGGRGHQSIALLVLDNPTETLNLSSASGRLYQSPVPYPSDPIIDSNPVCLFVCTEVAYWLSGNRSKYAVSLVVRQWHLHWSLLQWAVQLLSCLFITIIYSYFHSGCFKQRANNSPSKINIFLFYHTRSVCMWWWNVNPCGYADAGNIHLL